jgi:hypothetical protein
MAEQKVLPYVTGYGNITKTLDGIKTASTPERFTQDFLANTLNLKGGSPKPVIPFLKRVGFLGSDGAPSDLYQRFRNDSQSGAAAAKALRTGYRLLFDINESAQDLPTKDLRGVVIQATGMSPTSSTVKAIVGSFGALNAYADFSALAQEEAGVLADGAGPLEAGDPGGGEKPSGQIKLGYTINIQLPATSDIAVFNAIFKSLREHLL